MLQKESEEVFMYRALLSTV